MKFNPQAAAHFGGIWERLVQIFKLSLYKVIVSRTLTDEILNTISCEIEASMNSRPLTNVPYDKNDPLPLTRSHFLLCRSPVNLSSCVFIDKEKNLSKFGVQHNKLQLNFGIVSYGSIYQLNKYVVNCIRRQKITGGRHGMVSRRFHPSWPLAFG